MLLFFKIISYNVLRCNYDAPDCLFLKGTLFLSPPRLLFECNMAQTVNPLMSCSQYTYTREAILGQYNGNTTTIASQYTCNRVAICIQYVYNTQAILVQYTCNRTAILSQSTYNTHTSITDYNLDMENKSPPNPNNTIPRSKNYFFHKTWQFNCYYIVNQSLLYYIHTSHL